MRVHLLLAALWLVGAAPPARAAPPGQTFFRVVKGTDLVPFLLGGAVLIKNPADNRALAELRGNRLVRDESLGQGLGPYCPSDRRQLWGEWPERTFLLDGFAPWSTEESGSALLRWRKDRWVPAGTIDTRQILMGPYLGGTLVLEVSPDGPPWAYTLRQIDTSPGAPTPVPMRARGPQPSDDACVNALEWPLALSSSSAGEVLVVGVGFCRSDARADRSGKGVAERWSPGHRASTIEVLPFGLSSDAIVAARSPRDVWVAEVLPAVDGGPGNRTRLARFDGAHWRSVGTIRRLVRTMSAESNGTLWMTVRTSERDGDLAVLVKRGGSGALTTVTLPAEAGEPRQVLVRGPGDVWVATENGIYRTIRPEAELDWSGATCDP